MTSGETRRAFLDFFTQRDHREVPSSPLVIPGDPTLLFANAGMNQFKDVFTGKHRAEFARAASSQKCLRVSGKHNDLEQVGRTPRHHTFFEMLGNFSFGDYFKDEAIAYAWELITGVFGLPTDRLWVTVFGGSESVGPDDEAFGIWKDRIGVPASRILRLDEKDNFWRMGDTGPCGPCSEIHYDLGEDLAEVSDSTPATDERRYVEIWNLVFMEYDQQPDGTLSRLPHPSIDTGMGLERIAAVLQDRRSNYDTDLFQPIIAAAAGRAGVRYGEGSDADLSLRVIADHARALCFLVADGVVPANDKRGYVLRRIVRRAIRHGDKLGIEGPFLHEITPVVVDLLGEVYPELLASRDAILEVGRREEERFGETVSAGLRLLDKALTAADRKTKTLAGPELFRLYDTFGLPLDLARDIAEERGITLDMEGFEKELAGQRSRAQASWKGGPTGDADRRWSDVRSETATRFVGYERTRTEDSAVIAVRRTDGSDAPLEPGTEGEVLLSETPFYAEAGGQVGDTGWLVSPQARARVRDTRRPAPGLVVHHVVVEGGPLRPGDRVAAEIDEARRDAIRRNHTATHLLHAALREVLGTHVKQAGSLVAPDRLRFDFSHFSPVSDRALADIESLVNRKILEDVPVTDEVVELDDALRDGAMALFGEKYGDRVRVVSIGGFSKELCGGTHCARSGEIGLFKLTQERGIASGTRRVEAVSGEGSLERFRAAQSLVRSLEEVLAVPPEEILGEIERRLEQWRAAEREAEQWRLRAAQVDLVRKAEEAPRAAGVRVLAERVDALPPQEMRLLADRLRQALGSGVVVLGRAGDGKASILVAVTEDLTDRISAGDLVRELAKIIGGGGGGRRDLAEAGGKDPSRLDEALRQALPGVARRIEAPR